MKKWSIVPVCDAPHAIPTLAEWHFGQWGKWNPENTIEKRIERLQRQTDKSRLPMTIVALYGADPIGSASLVLADLETKEELSPWLASVFVEPNWRDQGVGTSLVQKVCDLAIAMQFDRIYLFTPDKERFYRGLGWKPVERSEYRGDPIVIMSLELSDRTLEYGG